MQSHAMCDDGVKIAAAGDEEKQKQSEAIPDSKRNAAGGAASEHLRGAGVAIGGDWKKFLRAGMGAGDKREF